MAVLRKAGGYHVVHMMPPRPSRIVSRQVRAVMLMCSLLLGVAGLAFVLGFPPIAGVLAAAVAGLVVLCAYEAFVCRRRRPDAPGARYVSVDDDGRVRELTADQREHLATEYAGGDGAMPHIKSWYGQRNALGSFRGYIERSRVPPEVAIEPAPEDRRS